MIYTIHEDSFILDDKLFNLTVDFPGNLRHIAFLEVSYFDAPKPKRDPYTKHHYIYIYIYIQLIIILHQTIHHFVVAASLFYFWVGHSALYGNFWKLSPIKSLGR